MKKILFVFLILHISMNAANAQRATTLTPQKHDLSFALGREFWYAAQSNYWGEDLGGKYIRLYISSTKNTKAYIEIRGKLDSLGVPAGKTVAFIVPDSDEMESSGVVENKAIHIWSNDAELTCYNMSHNPYTSDGEYLIPTIGWGTDYVVASYSSLFEGGGSYVYDLPATMAVVAAQTNTTVTIIPSCDCRQCTGGNNAGDANSTIVAYPQGVPFTVQLNRGQSLELIPVKAKDPDNYDLTGTIVHADKPIGLLGGAVCVNIPADHPYCDHIEDMLPPVRTWGENYYTANIAGATDNYARYLFISSVPGQTIYRHTCTTNDMTECVISNKYGIYWDELQGAQKFFSDQPFLLVQYNNSPTYPDGNNGVGDPAEAHVNPQEEYTKVVVFQTPQNVGNIVPYANSVNIFVHQNDADKTRIDGKGIVGLPSQCIDNGWEVFTVSNLATGPHTIIGGDSGVGAWIYGVGYDESYAWTTAAFEGTYQSPDTTPPTAVISGSCLSGHVALQDSGTNASQLAAIHADSAVNVLFTPDPTFTEGIARNSSYFDYSIINPDATAYLLVTTYDFAGNSRTFTLNYDPKPVSLMPPVLDFGVEPVGHAPVVLYDTIQYNGAGFIQLDSIWLANGTVGFQIDSSIAGPLDSGAIRIIRISFTPTLKTFTSDTLLIGGDCWAQAVILKGTGFSTEWSVDNADWPNVPFINVGVVKPVTVHNYSSITLIHVTSAIADSSEFAVDASSFPLAVPLTGTAQFNVTFTPLYAGQDISSQLRVQSNEAGERDATLSAEVTPSSGVTESPAGAATAMLLSQNGEDVRAIIPQNWAQPVHIEIENLLGVTVFEANLTLASTTTFDPGTLPHGVYFYRLTSQQLNQNGKIILGQ